MLTKVHNLIRASEVRKNFSKYLKASKTEPLVISTERGGEARVLINAPLYNKLIEEYEDRVDSEELDRLVKEDKGKRITLKALKGKYGV